MTSDVVKPTRTPADRAYRRAWLSFLLFPVTFVAAFVVGEGLFTLVAEDTDDPAFWEVLVSVTPALLVFALPAVLVFHFGRKAMRLGRADGKAPVMVAVALAGGFVVLNLVSFVAQLLFG